LGENPNLGFDCWRELGFNGHFGVRKGRKGRKEGKIKERFT
jgi:hypothetical protein